MSPVDYPELYRRLAQEILKRDGKIDADTQAFVRRLVTKLQAEGWRLSGDAETALNAHLKGINTLLKEAIASAVTVAAGLPLTATSLQSPTVLKMAEQAFTERWPDGLTLSERLWRWKTETRNGVQQQLQAAIRQSKGVNAVLYDLQRAIERGGDRFKIVTAHADDWVKELHESAVGLIHDPEARAAWKIAVGEAEERISLLKTTGSRSAAERVLDQIKKAVEKGSEELADKAVKWWVYDKQLYNLKRIARTEMATAAHRAVIASVEGDESIIGFRWRLSASHKDTDICDYYANIEMGLGKGVWTKEAVPHNKAHPQCLCLLMPRVTPIKQTGSKNYAEFIRNSPPERRNQLLPNWAQTAIKDGAKLDDLIRPDGLGLLSAKEARKPLFKVWSNRVAQASYKPRHEFIQVGAFPDFVLADSAVAALNPQNSGIHISDHQLRHALRPVKNIRGAALPMSIIEQLPAKLETAQWLFDAKHNNVLAVFDISTATAIGKAAVAVNFKKGKHTVNAIVTSGIVKPEDLNVPIYREILKNP